MLLNVVSKFNLKQSLMLAFWQRIAHDLTSSFRPQIMPNSSAKPPKKSGVAEFSHHCKNRPEVKMLAIF